MNICRECSQLLIIGVLYVLTGCHTVASKTNTPSMQDTQQHVNKETATIRNATQTISNDIQKVEEPTKSKINNNLETINTSTASIDDTIKVMNDYIREKNDDNRMIMSQKQTIEQQQHAIKTLKEEKYGLMSKMLAVMAGLSLTFAVASIFVLSNFRLAAFGGVLFSVCVAAQWLLNYALYIGLGTLAIIGIATYFVIRKERNAVKDVVMTVEAIKPYAPTIQDFKSTANRIQSFATQKIVDTIKRKHM